MRLFLFCLTEVDSLCFFFSSQANEASFLVSLNLQPCNWLATILRRNNCGYDLDVSLKKKRQKYRQRREKDKGGGREDKRERKVRKKGFCEEKRIYVIRASKGVSTLIAETPLTCLLHLLKEGRASFLKEVSSESGIRLMLCHHCLGARWKVPSRAARWTQVFVTLACHVLANQLANLETGLTSGLF